MVKKVKIFIKLREPICKSGIFKGTHLGIGVNLKD